MRMTAKRAKQTRRAEQTRHAEPTGQIPNGTPGGSGFSVPEQAPNSTLFDGNSPMGDPAQSGTRHSENFPAAKQIHAGILQGMDFPVKKTVFLCRAMRAEDVPACAAIEAAVPDGWSAGALAEELSQPTARLFVAEALGCSGAPAPRRSPPPQIAALAVFQLVCEEASLYTVSTAPALRRQGAARALLQYALAQMATQGAQTVFLEVRAQNTAARALYTALGFEETGTRRGFYAKPHDDAVLMQKAIGN